MNILGNNNNKKTETWQKIFLFSYILLLSTLIGLSIEILFEHSDFLFLKSNEEIKQYIDNNTNIIEKTAFYLAKKGNLEVIKYLIEEKNLDVNIKDKSRETILFNACESGNLELVKYLVEEKKLNVNIENIAGQIALYKAYKSGNLKLREYML